MKYTKDEILDMDDSKFLMIIEEHIHRGFSNVRGSKFYNTKYVLDNVESNLDWLFDTRKQRKNEILD